MCSAVIGAGVALCLDVFHACCFDREYLCCIRRQLVVRIGKRICRCSVASDLGLCAADSHVAGVALDQVADACRRCQLFAGVDQIGVRPFEHRLKLGDRERAGNLIFRNRIVLIGERSLCGIGIARILLCAFHRDFALVTFDKVADACRRCLLAAVIGQFGVRPRDLCFCLCD